MSPKQKNIVTHKDKTSWIEYVLRTFTRAWHEVRNVWKDSVFTASPASHLPSKAFQTCNTILYFHRVQGRGSYACSIDQHIYMCITPSRLFCIDMHELSTQWIFFIKLITNKDFQLLCIWFRASLIYINNCPSRCNTKQSIYYSASSIYMLRVSTTPVIRNTQNCNHSLRYCAATSLQSSQAIYINNCPTRCNTKQSIYYSASSIYMYFGCQQRPLSGVDKTVTTASDTVLPPTWPS